MTTLPVLDYYYTFLKKSSTTWTDFSGMAFEKFEQLNDLNIKHTKSSMTDTSEAIAAMLEIKDAKELMEFAQKSAGPVPSKVSAYFKEVYKINSDFLKSGSEYVEAESEEMNKVINDQVEEMSKNAPAGTEGVVAMTKSSLAASSSTYESMTKAAKQVFDIVDSNIEAASKAGESVVSQPVGKAKGKKSCLDGL